MSKEETKEETKKNIKNLTEKKVNSNNCQKEVKYEELSLENKGFEIYIQLKKMRTLIFILVNNLYSIPELDNNDEMYINSILEDLIEDTIKKFSIFEEECNIFH